MREDVNIKSITYPYGDKVVFNPPVKLRFIGIYNDQGNYADSKDESYDWYKLDVRNRFGGISDMDYPIRRTADVTKVFADDIWVAFNLCGTDPGWTNWKYWALNQAFDGRVSFEETDEDNTELIVEYV